MWGKLTERSNRTKTELISEPKELYKFLSTPGIEVVSVLFASDQVVWASWRYAEDESVPNLCHTNNIVGAYVTTGGRMQLYQYLDTLQDKALYCDTDSVIYIQPKSEPPLIETGDSLGAMTSELKPDVYIAQFAGASPKNYAYRTTNPATGEGKTTCKVRGVTLNYNASQLVNFDKIKEMILKGDEQEPVTVHTEKNIKRKRRKGGNGRINIINEPEDKTYSPFSEALALERHYVNTVWL
jgi:hypothetical protein